FCHGSVDTVPGSVDTRSESLKQFHEDRVHCVDTVPGSVDTSPSLQKTQLPDWDSVSTLKLGEMDGDVVDPPEDGGVAELDGDGGVLELREVLVGDLVAAVGDLPVEELRGLDVKGDVAAGCALGGQPLEVGCVDAEHPAGTVLHVDGLEGGAAAPVKVEVVEVLPGDDEELVGAPVQAEPLQQGAPGQQPLQRLHLGGVVGIPGDRRQMQRVQPPHQATLRHRQPHVRRVHAHERHLQYLFIANMFTTSLMLCLMCLSDMTLVTLEGGSFYCTGEKKGDVQVEKVSPSSRPGGSATTRRDSCLKYYLQIGGGVERRRQLHALPVVAHGEVGLLYLALHSVLDPPIGVVHVHEEVPKEAEALHVDGFPPLQHLVHEVCKLLHAHLVDPLHVLCWVVVVVLVSRKSRRGMEAQRSRQRVDSRLVRTTSTVVRQHRMRWRRPSGRALIRSSRRLAGLSIAGEVESQDLDLEQAADQLSFYKVAKKLFAEMPEEAMLSPLTMFPAW
ncbi:hypothetical protein Taro_000388, partial [Colocasia esculenta]|nr:hypothetical protein [Colocasia esculenta]